MDVFMQGFWEFAGNYWWLVFPLMGIAGGIGKTWERSAKRRHERRMETLRLKGELKAAQLAARGSLPARKAIARSPPTSASRRSTCSRSSSPSTTRSRRAGSTTNSTSPSSSPSPR